MFTTDLLLNNFLAEETLEQKALREGLGAELVALAETNPNIVVLNADLESSLKLEGFKQKFPERLIQVGVSEQAMAGIGTGLALYGKIPFITSFAAFSPGLNWSQLRLAAMSEANIKVASSHYGLNVGEDGPSAQALEDIALMRVLPNFTVLSPADYNQTRQVVRAAAAHQGPVYIRVTRSKYPVFLKADTDFKIGKGQLLREGKDITVIVTGSLVYEALQSSNLLEQQGISAELINIHTIKPLDSELIRRSIDKTGKLVIIEEHQIAGGLGSAVLEALTDKGTPPTLQLAVPDKFGRSGSGTEVVKSFGLDRHTFVARIKTLLS